MHWPTRRTVGARAGLAGAFAVSALSYVPFILVALWVLPRTAPAAPGVRLLDRHQLWAGVREVLHEPGLRSGLATVLATAMLSAPLLTFCPVLVKEVFRGDAGDFSTALGAFGLGGLIGAIGLLALDPHRDRRPLSTWFAVAYGVIVVLAALNRWAWGLPVLLVFMIYGALLGLVPALLCGVWLALWQTRRNAAGLLHAALAGTVVSGLCLLLVAPDMSITVFGLLGGASAVLLVGLLLPAPVEAA